MCSHIFTLFRSTCMHTYISYRVEEMANCARRCTWCRRMRRRRRARGQGVQRLYKLFLLSPWVLFQLFDLLTAINYQSAPLFVSRRDGPIAHRLDAPIQLPHCSCVVHTHTHTCAHSRHIFLSLFWRFSPLYIRDDHNF